MSASQEDAYTNTVGNTLNTTRHSMRKEHVNHQSNESTRVNYTARCYWQDIYPLTSDTLYLG
jgi:hypothetical protein